MADRIKAVLGSLAFLILAPGVVAGLVPWLITQWHPLPPGSRRVSAETHSCGGLGWPTGLEPVTFGATIRCSAG